MDECKLFACGIELLTKEDLWKHFSQYGNVNRVDIPKSAYTYAFIWFSTPSEAESAYEAGKLAGKKRRHYIIGSSASAYVTVNFQNKERETHGKIEEVRVRKFTSL